MTGRLTITIIDLEADNLVSTSSSHSLRLSTVSPAQGAPEGEGDTRETGMG